MSELVYELESKAKQKRRQWRIILIGVVVASSVLMLQSINHAIHIIG